MAHDHAHDHKISQDAVTKAFIIGIILNVAFVITETVAGLRFNSLALISDAGHNLTDVSSLLISLFALKMIAAKATDKFTYGYKKASILASLLNAILLLITVVVIIYEGIRRAGEPRHVSGNVISLVAVAGIFVNGISAMLFFRNKEKDINVKGAYLHLMTDALVSLGVVAAGLIINYTSWFWIDTVISFIIAFIILIATWRLLKASLRLAMDGIPENVDPAAVKKAIMQFDHVTDVHHLHIWAMSSSHNALTAHVVTDLHDINSFSETKKEIRHALEHLNITHATIEAEAVACAGAACVKE